MRENTLKIWGKNQFLKVKNSLLELGKDYVELKGRELKDREVNIKGEIDKHTYKNCV